MFHDDLWDNRWNGDHGIARFSREVFARLPYKGELFSHESHPLSISGFSALRRELNSRSSSRFISPSFAAVPSKSARQLLTIHDLIHLDVPEESSKVKRLYYSQVLKPAVRRAGMVLTVSNFTKKRIVEWSGLSEDCIKVIGNGTSPAIGSIDTAWPHLKISGAYILYVGNSKPHKNLRLLVRSVPFLEASFQTVLVGVRQASLLKLCQEEGVSPSSFVVLGRQSDAELFQLYGSAHALAIPSTYEGFGLTALEALAAGTASAYLCDAVAEVMDNCGIRVDSSVDGAEFAEGLERASRLKESAHLAMKARALNFGWDRAAQRFADAMDGFS